MGYDRAAKCHRFVLGTWEYYSYIIEKNTAKTWATDGQGSTHLYQSYLGD